MEFGERLKIIRKKMGLTQSEFADALGIGQPYVSQLESERERPSDLLISAICNRFAIRKEWLIKGEGDMQQAPEDWLKWGIKLFGEEKLRQVFLEVLSGPNDNVVKYQQPIMDQEFTMILDWLKELWLHSDRDTQGWLKVQLKRTFPEFEEAQKKQRGITAEGTANGA